ncbi:MAG: hypothetical protein AAFP68_15700 [Pseudomonadota bacterium]
MDVYDRAIRKRRDQGCSSISGLAAPLASDPAHIDAVDRLAVSKMDCICDPAQRPQDQNFHRLSARKGGIFVDGEIDGRLYRLGVVGDSVADATGLLFVDDTVLRHELPMCAIRGLNLHPMSGFDIDPDIKCTAAIPALRISGGPNEGNAGIDRRRNNLRAGLEVRRINRYRRIAQSLELRLVCGGHKARVEPSRRR